MFGTNILVFALSTMMAVGTVSAHGYVPQIKIGNNYIAGWDISRGQRYIPIKRSTVLDRMTPQILILPHSHCVSFAERSLTPATFQTYTLDFLIIV